MGVAYFNLWIQQGLPIANIMGMSTQIPCFGDARKGKVQFGNVQLELLQLEFILKVKLAIICIHQLILVKDSWINLNLYRIFDYSFHFFTNSWIHLFFSSIFVCFHHNKFKSVFQMSLKWHNSLQIRTEIPNFWIWQDLFTANILSIPTILFNGGVLKDQYLKKGKNVLLKLLLMEIVL